MQSVTEIQQMSLQSLKPYVNNPRNNSQAVDVVKRSINEFGFLNPIIVDENMVIVAGHTRFQASIELGLVSVPVIIARDLTEEQINAFRIMDNKSSDFAEWDSTKLYEEIKALESSGYDIKMTGFDLIDYERMKLELDDMLDSGDIPDDPQDNEDEEEESTAIVQYNIIFNSEAEQKAWFSFIKYLKDKYPDDDTISERLVKEIGEVMSGGNQ